MKKPVYEIVGRVKGDLPLLCCFSFRLSELKQELSLFPDADVVDVSNPVWNGNFQPTQ